MTPLARIERLLPPPYATARDAVLMRLLEAFALEFEALQEDLDRLRRSHWIRFAYRLEDAAKLGALLGIAPLPWEGLPVYRERLLALVVARLKGALGPDEIKGFVYDYLRGVETALDSLFLPGLRTVTAEEAYADDPARTRYRRRLRLIENPPRPRRSGVLRARGGRIEHLFAWTEANTGLDETMAEFRLRGLPDGRTAVPLIANLTTGTLILYADVVPAGALLRIAPAAPGGDPRAAQADLDGRDVSDRLVSASFATHPVPRIEARDTMPLLPRFARGDNRWQVLFAGLHGAEGLDHVFFALTRAGITQGSFGESRFDEALFRTAPAALLEMRWIETEPASFVAEVPRYVTSEPAGLGLQIGGAPHALVAQALEDSLLRLRGAGIRARLRLAPFAERQRQRARLTASWKVLPPERAPSGRARLAFSGRYGTPSFGEARFD